MPELRFKLEMTREQSAALWSVLERMATTRACRTCDYGDDPACGHKERGKRVCAAPGGGVDCPIMPCLGACAMPGGAS